MDSPAGKVCCEYLLSPQIQIHDANEEINDANIDNVTRLHQDYLPVARIEM